MPPSTLTKQRAFERKALPRGRPRVLRRYRLEADARAGRALGECSLSREQHSPAAALIAGVFAIATAMYVAGRGGSRHLRRRDAAPVSSVFLA
jgi:hypothetical protein